MRLLALVTSACTHMLGQTAELTMVVCGIVVDFQMLLKVTSILLPIARCLPGGVQNNLFVLIGDDAFALKKYMMKPYLQQNLTTERRVYNYRHNRARRISENLFGILGNRWCIFHTVILLVPKTVESIILSTLALHNMLIKSSTRRIYCPTGLVDTENVNRELTNGLWRNDIYADSMLSLEILARGHNTSVSAK